MYRIIIKTKYNVITLEREDYNTPELKEVYEQPYVEEIKIEKIKTLTKVLKKRKRVNYSSFLFIQFINNSLILFDGI